MLQFDGVSAWVEVDGRRLKEYQVEVDQEERTVCCYIISEVGKAFVVHYRWTQEHLGLVSADLTVDGHLKAGIFSEWSHEDEEKCIDHIDVRDDEKRFLHAARPTFAPIQLTDDESLALSNEDLVKALGAIELKVARGRESEPTTSDGDDDSEAGQDLPAADDEDEDEQEDEDEGFEELNGDDHATKPIYERMKRVLSHRVVLGETLEPLSLYEGHFVEDTEHTTVFFKFLYRAKDLLQAQGIVPREMTPVKLEPVAEAPAGPSNRTAPIKREEDDEEEEEEQDAKRAKALREEVEELEERLRLRALKAELAAIEERSHKRKSKAFDKADTKKRKIGADASSSGLKHREIIDLTD